MLSQGQDRPATGPPKVKGRFVFDLDTEMYAKLQQGELMIGYPDILLFELG